MKKYLLLFLLTFSALFSYSQDYLTLANNCYEQGDYDCARDSYQKYLEKSPNDQDIIILRERAGECSIYKIAGDMAFDKENYKDAKQNYEAILNINPYDSNAKTRIEKCNRILVPVANLNISKEDISFDVSGGSETVSVTTNVDGYTISQLPSWCFVSKGTDRFELSCNANSSTFSRTGEFKVTARDKEVTVRVSQEGVETTLGLSAQSLQFDEIGGFERITVETNYDTYDVRLLPSWYTIDKSGGEIVVHCRSNYGKSPRENSFIVSAGDKEISVTVFQSGVSSTQAITSNRNSQQHKKSSRQTSCFNCPTAKYSWGLSVGYIIKNLAQDDLYIEDDGNYSVYPIEIKGIQAGIKYEPLFKYGFGLNTGIFYEYYSQSLDESLGGYFDQYYDYYFYQHVINIPFHLEYRLNFSRYFNLFVFGGAGLDGILDSFSDEMRFKTSIEYGWGLRIDHFQFNLGQSLLINEITDLQDFDRLSNNKYKKLMLSVAYMF